jgi:hypothetical protein
MLNEHKFDPRIAIDGVGQGYILGSVGGIEHVFYFLWVMQLRVARFEGAYFERKGIAEFVFERL